MLCGCGCGLLDMVMVVRMMEVKGMMEMMVVKMMCGGCMMWCVGW